jgi:inosine-uridine nucleoside N-ribohydrolase
VALRVWVDTDVGDDPDDAIALLCAVGHPGIDLVGVSTVDGDHDRRVRAARALVDAPRATSPHSRTPSGQRRQTPSWRSDR